MCQPNEKMRKFNALSSEINAMYHDAAVRLGISDSVFNILYFVCENDDRCSQSRIYKESGISRKTINSAIHKLKRDGIISLERGKGGTTTVCLTELGKIYAHGKIDPVYRIENAIFDGWTDDEQEEILRLNAMYRDSFRKKMEDLVL